MPLSCPERGSTRGRSTSRVGDGPAAAIQEGQSVGTGEASGAHSFSGGVWLGGAPRDCALPRVTFTVCGSRATDCTECLSAQAACRRGERNPRGLRRCRPLFLCPSVPPFLFSETPYSLPSPPNSPQPPSPPSFMC